MTEGLEFLKNVLPWMALGLFVVFSCIKAKAQREDRELSPLFRAACLFPALCLLFVAILEMSSGNKTGGTIWLVLGVFQVVSNCLSTGDAG